MQNRDLFFAANKNKKFQTGIFIGRYFGPGEEVFFYQIFRLPDLYPLNIFEFFL